MGRGASWYRGDCHVHSVHSDGELTPKELAYRARAVGLDFIATTEHNSAAAPGVWTPLAADDFLIMLGEEVTSKTGHWLALGTSPGQIVDWNCRARDGLIERCLDQVHRVGGLCVVAHPHAPYLSGDFMYSFRGFDAVEVWNGPWTSDRPGTQTTRPTWQSEGGVSQPASTRARGCRRWATAPRTRKGRSAPLIRWSSPQS
ncbi:CehA/McbA family metallohydrolase [Streptomyces sp. NPDC048425]|uniref:CehA/McbA family metallohydrolase n=1 Tax=Streptomyces sp. NPDC048425 TaxID=3365548 RepID=UPI003722A0AD